MWAAWCPHHNLAALWGTQQESITTKNQKRSLYIQLQYVLLFKVHINIYCNFNCLLLWIRLLYESGGGTHPRKVRVCSAEVVKMKLYLYERVKKGGLFYIFAAKKWGLFYTFLTKIEVKFGKFSRNLGKNQYFGVESCGKSWNSTEIRGLFYMKAERWRLFYMSTQKRGLSYIFWLQKRGSIRQSIPAHLFNGSAPPPPGLRVPGSISVQNLPIENCFAIWLTIVLISTENKTFKHLFLQVIHSITPDKDN